MVISPLFLVPYEFLNGPRYPALFLLHYSTASLLIGKALVKYYESTRKVMGKYWESTGKALAIP